VERGLPVEQDDVAVLQLALDEEPDLEPLQLFVEVVAEIGLDISDSRSKGMDELEGGVDAVVCSGVGRRALSTLETAGIRVLTTPACRVDEVLESLRAGALREMTAREACAGHPDDSDCHRRS